LIAFVLIIYFITREYTRTKIRKKEQEFEKLRLVEEERMRIARDMHDDLGGGLTTIKMMSEQAGREKNDPLLDDISNTAVDLVDRMRQIVWTLNEDQNSVGDLLYYMVAYSRDYLRKNQIGFSCTPVPESEIKLTSVERRNVFLSVKEILTNVVKHSDAKNVRIELDVSHGELKILIRDDGKGLSVPSENNYGNGLKNIKKRIEQLNGTIDVQNMPGLQITLRIELKELHLD